MSLRWVSVSLLTMAAGGTRPLNGSGSRWEARRFSRSLIVAKSGNLPFAPPCEEETILASFQGWRRVWGLGSTLLSALCFPELPMALLAAGEAGSRPVEGGRTFSVMRAPTCSLGGEPCPSGGCCEARRHLGRRAERAGHRQGWGWGAGTAAGREVGKHLPGPQGEGGLVACTHSVSGRMWEVFLNFSVTQLSPGRGCERPPAWASQTQAYALRVPGLAMS